MTLTEAISYCNSGVVGLVHLIAPNNADANRDVLKFMRKVHLGVAWIGIFATEHDPKFIIANESRS